MVRVAPRETRPRGNHRPEIDSRRTHHVDVITKRIAQPHHFTAQQSRHSVFFRNYHFPQRSESAKTDKGGGLNDSIWATVLGIAKTFGVTPEYALHGISYANVVLYSHSIPIPGEDSDNKNNDDAPLYDDSKDACQDIDLTGIDEETIEQLNKQK